MSGVSARPEAVRVIQLSFSRSGNGSISFTCTSLAGEALCTVALHESDSMMAMAGKIAEELAASSACLKIVLPKGGLLESVPASTQVGELVNSGPLEGSMTQPDAVGQSAHRAPRTASPAPRQPQAAAGVVDGENSAGSTTAGASNGLPPTDTSKVDVGEEAWSDKAMHVNTTSIAGHFHIGAVLGALAWGFLAEQFSQVW
eukprot:CAMPEP_0172830762 /NCGR_PEP_ID=MMETSP1075-20121228/22485_1 /TAXON_ID=2916 /ORGANISM="Ceratium fusus, Strain PA161109" /LENGTH=200 /DNA_ID=CAMNT_0013673101 /DNA_START=72 /DNA_END=670 /DNA_ORIENTATION=+